MAKKQSKKPSKGGRGAPPAAGGDVADARFAAAAARPQFARAREDGDAPSGSLAAVVGGGTAGPAAGLGASLTQAIASDDRFKAALDDSGRFGVVPGKDKYGRKARKKKDKRRKEEDEGDGSDFGEDGDRADEEQGEEGGTKAEQKEESDEEEDTSMEARIAYLNALSRGDISASSSSDSSSSSSSSDDDDDSDADGSASSNDVHGKSGIFDPAHKPLPGDVASDEEELTDDPSPYLCILNLNWEHTRAVDVYAMLHSFCPPGTLKGVEVYPSDFGRERMEREKLEGPTGLWKREKAGGGEEGNADGSIGNDSSSEGSDDEEDGKDERNSGGGSDGSEAASDDDDEEDALNLAEATAKLYAHFPPQSSVTKNSHLQTEDEEEGGFDLEKLREYEASKLRYYFAVATFSSAAAAAAAYEHVDGMEMEHSAAEIDVRVLPEERYPSAVEGRPLRDRCDRLPAKYAPPEDNVAAALRQSRVACSWERGDAERERKLTRYGMGREAWEALAGGDDVRFYLATSDQSSGEEEEGSDEEGRRKKKGAGMRALLGLAASDSEDEPGGGKDGSGGSDSDDGEEKGGAARKPSAESESESEFEEEEAAEEEAKATAKQATFTPGKRDLEQKIRSKLHAKQAGADADGSGGDDSGEGGEVTPFQKYLEKRKQKRRERRQAARNARKKREASEDGDDGEDDGMYEADPEFGVARFSDEESDNDDEGVDQGGDDGDEEEGFFLGETSGKTDGRKTHRSSGTSEEAVGGDNVASTKEELELLVAGDDDEEAQKDYDMRGLAKLERHSHKKLRGKRKRQLETLAANVSGRDFCIDAADDRFAALLDGDDDRFGIDRTHPAYKETGAMRELLREQSKRRARKGRGERKPKKVTSNPSEEKGVDREGGWVEQSRGAMELSSLVRSLKHKVAKGGDVRKRKKGNAQ